MKVMGINIQSCIQEHSLYGLHRGLSHSLTHHTVFSLAFQNSDLTSAESPKT